MLHKHFQARTTVTWLTLVTFLAAPIAPLTAQAQTAKPTPTPTATPKPSPTPTAKPSPTPGAKPATTQAATTAKPPVEPPPPDGGWPRAKITPKGATLVMYQPQVASWENQKHIALYAAVAYQAKGASQPAMGTIRIESESSVALDERLVNFFQLRIATSNFPGLNRDQTADVVNEILQTISLEDRVIGLDRVLANIDASAIKPKNVDGVIAEPPPIFFSKTPAMLVNIDGEPIWSPIPQNDLQSAVNTNWDLFQHVPTKTFYVRNDKVWMKTTDIVKGPWVPAGTLPESFKKLPNDDNWKEVRDSLPGRKVSPEQAPKVFVSLRPAEMILLKGEPTYATITGAKTLLWVSNTDADVFRMGKTGPVYFLVAGRWFGASDFTGPWKFVSLELPEDFKAIPLEHERSRVLASVPGTAQAAEAVLLAQVPQTARVKKNLQAPPVEYGGDKPVFQPIEKTKGVELAMNTDKDVLKVGDMYYMAYEGVWFKSTSPTGPFTVASEIPKEIYEIPTSSPAHSVTYITVEEDDDDEVLFATTLAFTGMMVAWGCVVWGSGWYYPPYYGGWYGGYYGGYYPRYPTYGFGASYNPWTGAYTRGAVAYGPYGGAGVAQRYNPRTGTYSRGAAAWGPYGARGAASAYNPRTNTAARTRQGSNVYGSWGSTSVARGDSWANTKRVTNNATGNTTRVTQGSGGGTAVTRRGPGDTGGGIAKTGGGDIYAGNDGNVYRRQDGQWQSWGGADGGGWSNVDKPAGSGERAGGAGRDTGSGTAGRNTGAGQTGAGVGNTSRGSWDPKTQGQVTRDAGARTEGARRTTDLGSVRSGSAGASRMGSYRPTGGGGARAGGGRRGH